ncbi:phosphotransferase family protein [Qipengyuania sediminis]|uniref:phosphotransferase family protein n=1 Tax=Qipengyuania sediminis TaxID=1532023 RepID=UPI00105A7EFB|nr:phosphotransferase family protein [Qipengyuania sediminis]
MASALGAASGEVSTAALAASLLEAARAAGLAAEEVRGLAQLSGGASKEMWRFDLHLAEGEALPLVLRRQPPGRALSSQGLGGVGREAALLRFADKAGVPVPAPAFVLPTASSAGDGYAMARIEGETIGTRVLRLPELAEARRGLARRCGEVLARLHAARGFKALGLRSEGSAEALAALAARYRATGQHRPVFDFALAWLGDNLPRESSRVLLHGDFRTGNLVIGPEGLRAVLDWELAHIGPPAADLAWLCVPSWRFQHPELAAGGFGAREDLLAGYESAGGTRIEPAELFAWEVFQVLNWGVMCAGAGRAFMDGARSVEGAVIARRASETEFDLMRMLAPDDPLWRAEPVRAARFDDPPAALIVAQVRAALAQGIAPGFAEKVAVNALGIAERELAAKTDPDAGLVAQALGKLVVDQPGYPPLLAWRSSAQ